MQSQDHNDSNDDEHQSSDFDEEDNFDIPIDDKSFNFPFCRQSAPSHWHTKKPPIRNAHHTYEFLSNQDSQINTHHNSSRLSFDLFNSSAELDVEQISGIYV